jgi:uncharacterized protein (TIRG00374 family)
MDIDLRGVVVGFAGAAVVLAALLWLVGVGEIEAAFALLDLRFLAVILGVGLLWLSSWAMALRTVLDALGVQVSVVEAVTLYASSAFANNVTPFGQAGGEPFSALLIARATGFEYERSLAAVASVDSLNFVPSIVLALGGLVYYLTTFAVSDDLLGVLALVVALAVAVPVALVFAWSNRDRVEAGVVRAVAPVTRMLGRVLPRVTPPTAEEIRGRVASFFAALERVGDSPRQLLVAVTFSTLGWLLMCTALWLSLFSLGHAVPVAAVLVAVPVGTIAGVAPLPGGLGSVEFAIVLVVVPATGVSAATATSAALVYRGATYWLPTLLGGASVAWLEGRRSARRRRL